MVVVACGDGDDAAAPATDIGAELKEFQFTPNDWTIAAVEEITINLKNAGSTTHEWVLLKDGVEISSEADLPDTEEELLADFVYWEEEVEAGDSKTLTFTAPGAGSYQIICALEGHFDAGMKGTLEVKAP